MAAREWGVPPWEVEEQASAAWLARFAALRAEELRAQERAARRRPGWTELRLD